jgi:ribosome-associated protein
MSEEELDESAQPSKSERKRRAHAAQTLGERLIGLADAELDRLGLPERLLDALRAARRITSRAAAVRQRQYIGKLMRDVDTSGIVAALEARQRVTALEAERFRRVETWRDRLLAEGSTALDALGASRADADVAPLRTLLERARDERAAPGIRAAASRELFRRLRALLR